MSLTKKLSDAKKLNSSLASDKQSTSFPSKEDWKQKFSGSTSPPKPKQYTGNQMLGIATMHKSNAVPVFSTESAKDISKMK